MPANLSVISESYSIAFADYIRSLEREGRPVAKLQTGDPDFGTHPDIVEAAHEAMLNGEAKYSDSRGLPELREALSDKLQAENAIECSADENILITHGAVHAIGMAIRALIGPGDECIIIEPYWRAYEMNVLLAGGVPVIVPAVGESGFDLSVDSVIQRMGPRTRMIIVNTPNNPSGAVYGREALTRLALTAAEHGIYIMADEVYESIVFRDAQHFSVASCARAREWVITVFSFSKTYAMTGWRVGYLVAGKEIIDQVLKLSQFSITSLSPFSQRAALAALQDDSVRQYVEFMRGQYEERRERIGSMIKGSWLEEAMTQPQGTFYVLVDVSRFGVPSLELARRIVDLFGVALAPGIAFGDSMDSYLRMCFAASDEDIESAINALRELK